MARRHAGTYKGAAPAGPSTAREELDGQVLGSIATLAPVEATSRYGAADGATYCPACGDWWLGNRPPGSDPKATHDPKCRGTMAFTDAVVRCDKGCGCFFNTQLPGMPAKYLYEDHLKRYTHYAHVTGDWDWASWDSKIEASELVPEAVWANAKQMGWVEHPKKTPV